MSLDLDAPTTASYPHDYNSYSHYTTKVMRTVEEVEFFISADDWFEAATYSM